MRRADVRRHERRQAADWANAFLFDYTGLTLPRREYRRAHCALCAHCARIARSAHSAHNVPCASCALSDL